jgi:hypothetical protein
MITLTGAATVLSRRALLRSGAVLIGAATARVRNFQDTTSALAVAAPNNDVSGWPRFQQDQLGFSFQYPPGWTPRTLEAGMASVASGRDGLTGARALGQLFTLRQGVASGTLISVLATNLALLLDQFTVVEGARLSSNPDISALRYTMNYVDGPRKGTLVAMVSKRAAVTLAFDAPAAQYAGHLPALTTVIQTFRWFPPTLPLQQVVEPREGAFTAMVPVGWRATLQVIRPAVDAGFVARASDPSGQITAEAHLPQTPFFALPNPAFGIREGGWFTLANGIDPYLVMPYMPGKEYIRSFLQPQARRSRPDLHITGLGDRPDLATSAEAATFRRQSQARVEGGEAEYAWTGSGGIRMRGRVVALTILVPSMRLWSAPSVIFAEAPEAQINTAVAAAITLAGSIRPVPVWLAAEIKGARERWRILIETQRKLFEEYQSVIQHRQDVVAHAAEQWDQYIRYTFSGSSDFGPYTPLGPDTIMTADGKVVRVVGLGGQTVAGWTSAQGKAGGSTFLHKAW